MRYAILLIFLISFIFTFQISLGEEKNVWTITEEVIISNETKEIAADIYVESGGKLVIDGATLKMMCEVIGQYSLIVREGGEIIVKNSTITSSNPYYYYAFEIYGAAEIYDSEIAMVRGHFNDGGIYIYSDSVEIINSTIHDCQFYAIIINGSSPKVIGSEIYNNKAGIKIVDGGMPKIASSKIYSNEKDGLTIISSSPIITECSVFKNWRGIGCYRSAPLIERCTISENGNVGIDASEVNGVSIKKNKIINNGDAGIYIFSSDLEIETNEILGNEFGIKAEFSDVKCNNNNIAGNREWGVYAASTQIQLEDDVWSHGNYGYNHKGQVVRYWSLKVKVTLSGEAIKDIQVSVWDSLGNNVWKGKTDENGDTEHIRVLEYYIDNDGKKHSLNPYKICVKSRDGKTFEKEVVMDQDRYISADMEEGEGNICSFIALLLLPNLLFIAKFRIF